jgi:hypothetical protein
MTGDKVNYISHHDIREEVKDIPVRAFRQAVRLIEIDGQVFSGAEAAYRTLAYQAERSHWYRLYLNHFLFRLLSKAGYTLVARNRPFLFRLTKLLWGANPRKPQHFRGYLLTFCIGILSGLILGIRSRRRLD